MLTVGGARSLRILTLALQKRDTILNSLGSATRSRDEAGAHLRAIESKYCHNGKAATATSELSVSHVRRGA